MQNDGVGQETDVRWAGLPSAPTSGLGDDQVPPEYAYRVSAPSLVATQERAVGHETHDRPPRLSDCGFDHEPAEYVWTLPPESTAAQNAADEHEMEVNLLLLPSWSKTPCDQLAPVYT